MRTEELKSRWNEFKEWLLHWGRHGSHEEMEHKESPEEMAPREEGREGKDKPELH